MLVDRLERDLSKQALQGVRSKRVDRLEASKLADKL